MLQYTVVENTVVKYNKNREEYYTVPMYSVNAIEIQFILDESWEEYVITAQISNGEKTYNLLLQNNTAFIPADITQGIWNVSIFGVKGEEKRNTTISSDFYVVEEGFKSDGQPPIPPEPDLYQKLIEQIEKGNEIAQSVRDDADAGRFDGEDGNGIEKIELLSKVEKTSIYKITFTDGSTFEYQVLDGQNGINGVNGTDGITPTIGENGNWFIADIDTGKPARGEKGEQGVQGVQGIQGVAGQDGKDGITPDISINATVNNAVGTPSVSIEKTGTTENPVFNLSFENLKGERGLKGDKGEQGIAGTNGTDGKSATITVGTVTTVSPDTPASVINAGTTTDAIFDFEIPKGENGIPLEELEKIAIKTTIEGNPAMSSSSADWRAPLIEAYGQSTQGADPTPEAPQELFNQNITRLKISDGNGKEQIVNLSAPIILRGFPSEKGNVTIDGEMYLSDYIGQKDGVFGVFRKTQEITDNGEASWAAYDTYQGFFAQLLKKSSSRLAGLCNQAKILDSADIPITENTMWIGVGNAFVFFLKTNFYNTNLPDKGTANWKAHLAENPLKIITVADEETFEPLPEADQQALKQIKTFYPTSIISWETEDGGGAWTRVKIIHDPANYIDEKLEQITAQQTALQAEILKIGGSI